MAMRDNTKLIEFTDGKICKIRASYRNGTSGNASSFVSEFTVSVTGGNTVSVSEDDLLKGLKNNYFDKLIAIQSDAINWSKVFIEPDVGEPAKSFYGFVGPLTGKLSGKALEDHDYVLNLLMENSNQSRNVIIPGVASDLLSSTILGTEKATLEGALVKGFTITDKLKLIYIRINKKDLSESVVGALFTGFRKRKERK